MSDDLGGYQVDLWKLTLEGQRMMLVDGSLLVRTGVTVGHWLGHGMIDSNWRQPSVFLLKWHTPVMPWFLSSCVWTLLAAPVVINQW